MGRYGPVAGVWVCSLSSGAVIFFQALSFLEYKLGHARLCLAWTVVLSGLEACYHPVELTAWLIHAGNDRPGGKPSRLTTRDTERAEDIGKYSPAGSREA